MGYLETAITKIPPAKGKWRCVWMKLLCRLGEHTQVPRCQLHQDLWFFPPGSDTGFELDKWRFSLVFISFSARKNEGDGSYNRNGSDSSIFPVVFYKCLCCPFHRKCYTNYFTDERDTISTIIFISKTWKQLKEPLIFGSPPPNPSSQL